MTFGFKEWTLVCDALGRGEQSIILRKGGIAEGRAGFHFEHEEFLLFPTLFHEQAQKLKVPAETALRGPRGDGFLQIQYRAKVEWAEEIHDMATARRLAPYHLWRDEVIEERFRYKDDPRISLAFLRVEKLSGPFAFPDLPKYGGCRSWVQLPDVPAEVEFTPVLEDALHRERGCAIREALNAPAAAGAR